MKRAFSVFSFVTTSPVSSVPWRSRAPGAASCATSSQGHAEPPPAVRTPSCRGLWPSPLTRNSRSLPDACALAWVLWRARSPADPGFFLTPPGSRISAGLGSANQAGRRFPPHGRKRASGHGQTGYRLGPMGRVSHASELGHLTVSPHPGRPAIKQFAGHDPVAKGTCAQAWRRATAHNARRFLDKLQADTPFPIEAIQVGGGSGFKADFETECQRRSIDLFAQARRPRRAQQQCLALRVPHHMGPARRRHRPMDRRLRRRVQHLPTTPGSRRTIFLPSTSNP